MDAPKLRPTDGELDIILYDSFVFGVTVEERYGVFGAALILNDKNLVFNLFGEHISEDSDKDSIFNSFRKN